MHLLSIALLTWLPTADDDAWPDYRGRNGDGRLAGARIPHEWSERQAVRWKTAIHGRGWSSPVVSGKRIWITTATPDGHELSVLSVDLETGKILHDRLLFEVEKPDSRNALNSYASPSPVVEKGRVYVHFGTYGTACLDAATAQVLWQRRDIHCAHLMGPGSSPVLYENLLIFHMDGADVQYVIALDKASGKTAWKVDRSTDFTKIIPDMRKAYSTPLLVKRGEGVELISSGAQATFGYDPRTGEELWSVRHKGFSMSARPCVAVGHVFLNTGFNRPTLWAVRLGGEGDVTDTHVSWVQRKNVASMASTVFASGLIFMVNDGGIASCLDARTGKVEWRERIGGQHCASPIVVGDRVVYFDREGQSVAVRASKQYEVLAKNQLDDGFMASPAILSDSLILRSKTHLYRIGIAE